MGRSLSIRFLIGFLAALLPLFVLCWALNAIRLLYSDPDMPLWAAALSSVLWPLVLGVFSAALAAVFIRLLIAREMTQLERDLADYSATGIAPDRLFQGAKSRETRSVRQTLADLVQKIAADGEVSEARLVRAETLQMEVFHRVSNNFQIIQSMVRLVARDGSIPNPMGVLEERIQLLSLAHHAQHRLDEVDMRPVAQAIPALIGGMQQAGFLAGKDLSCSLTDLPISVPRGYAVLHITTEVLRLLDKTGATRISISLSDRGLTIASDCTSLTPDQTTARLCAAFAQDLKGALHWTGGGLQIRYAPEAPSGPGPGPVVAGSDSAAEPAYD